MKCILVIDGDGIQRRAVGKALADVGYQVFFAADGSEALKALSNHQCDLLFFAVVLPDMDGAAFLKSLRADPQHRGIPAVLVRGTSWQDAILAPQVEEAKPARVIFKSSCLPQDVVSAAHAILGE